VFWEESMVSPHDDHRGTSYIVVSAGSSKRRLGVIVLTILVS
jgi:hypothetical protein